MHVFSVAGHFIQDLEALTEAVNRAVPPAEEGKLVRFGIVPTEAYTGYGTSKKGNEKALDLSWKNLLKSHLGKLLMIMFTREILYGTAACFFSKLVATLRN